MHLLQFINLLQLMAEPGLCKDLGALVRSVFFFCAIVLPDPYPWPQSGWQGHHRGDHGRGFREQEFNASCRSPVLYPHPTTGMGLSRSPVVDTVEVSTGSSWLVWSFSRGERRRLMLLGSSVSSNPPPCVSLSIYSASLPSYKKFMIAFSPQLHPCCLLLRT